MINSLLRVSDEAMEKLDYNGKLNSHEIIIAKDLVEILTPFKSATDLAQGDRKVTASIVLLVIRGLKSELNELEKQYKSRLVASLKASIVSRLSKYEDDEGLRIASALDPRWKLAWCTAAEASNMKQLVMKKAQELKGASSPITVTTSAPDSEVPPPKKRSRLFTFMTDTPITTSSSDSSIHDQVNQYFDSPCVVENSDPLLFWKDHQHQFPDLAKLSCRYLHVPASSAPVERLFSIAGKIFRPDRCLLKDELFEKLMFVRCNKEYI